MVLGRKVSKSGTLWKDALKWYSMERYLKVVLCVKIPKSGTL